MKLVNIHKQALFILFVLIGFQAVHYLHITDQRYSLQPVGDGNYFRFHIK